ncbi:glycoside hydrolase family 5 protein [bacterium]|nr:glycoside hydrolase family 5 protein [bacterium]
MHTPTTAVVLAAFALLWAGCLQAQPTPPKVGDIVFQTDFETAASRDAWSKNPVAQWVQVEGRGQCLQVTVPADQANGSNMIQLPLDLKRFRGCRLVCECLAKAQDATKPPASYLGVKFMLHYASPASGQFWRNQDNVFGTFDWKKLEFVAPLADDVTAGDLSLGLQGSSGTVWFDDLKISVLKLPPPPRPQPPANPGPVFKGHNLPRLRGVMSPNEFKDEDLRVLTQEWHANVIRWQMTRRWGQAGTDRDLAEYDKWLNAELDDLDKVLEAGKRYGLKVVVDMHSPPGGRYENHEVAIFHEKLYQDHWIALWEQIARRYKGNPVVWGYDLINEPVQSAPPKEQGVGDYFDGQVKCATAIRAIDPNIPVFIESAEWDSPGAYREMQPVNLPNIVYQVHMYVPGEFTHQGVFNKDQKPVTYPGVINGTEWNKERLRSVLQPVREFQLAYNVHIYVGEFSAIRWAPGAAQYLSDVISLFEEYGWDWTYHAYREWDGWSLEHGPDKDNHQPTAEPCDRKQVLLGWFAKDEKPTF